MYDVPFYAVPVVNALLFIYKALALISIPYALGFSIIVLTIVIRLILYPVISSQLKATKKKQDVNKHLKKHKLGIIRDLAGHGVGYKLHEEPLIPNYGKQGTGPELKEGMVIAIEPMATLGTWRIVLDPDEWTFRTADGSLAAHFEHTVAVTSKGAEILTPLENLQIIV